MTRRGVAILGATGSVGTSALRVLARHRDRFRVAALTANDSAGLLRERLAALGDDAPLVGLVRGNGDADPTWERGPHSLVRAATLAGVDIVINAVVGAAGLEATLAALAAGKRVALANKETLVMAGEFATSAAAAGGGEIVPVDSEHSAILQCLTGHPTASVRRLVLTASGGPFRGWSAEQVGAATVSDALCHPTWRMGRKISVDSATLANKALEVIEAHHLFGIGYDRIDVVVHPQSIVHSMVEFVDGSVVAQLGVPSMELPILYALTHPERIPDAGAPALDLTAAPPLTFEPVDVAAFPALRLGIEAGRAGGAAPAVFNAANEVAVEAFLAGRIALPAIASAIDTALGALASHPAGTLDDVVAADGKARSTVREWLARC